MDIKTAVKDKANYSEIVSWFQAQRPLKPDQLVLLVDTIDAMSEEIFEYYKALLDLLREELQRIRRIDREKGTPDGLLDASGRKQMAYVLRKACDRNMILSEKYEDMMAHL